jgi:pyruvate formate lyase activating enzyme
MVDKEAILWHPAGNGRIVCFACNRRCSIPEGSHGFCYVRKNVEGKLYLASYGKLAAMQIDPIEKKPFNHFHPGTHVFTVGTVSCNWHCHPAGTEITLADGSTKSVESLRRGDEIWSYDVTSSDTSKSKPKRNVVTDVRTRRGELLAVWWIEWGPDQKNERRKTLITGDHPVLTKEGWKEVATLKPGDHLLRVWPQVAPNRIASQKTPEDKQPASDPLKSLVMENDKQWVRVLDVEHTGQITTVYGFECIPSHTYVADGILVHNCLFCQNHSISKETDVYGEDVPPERVPMMAAENDCEGVGFSYNEPTIFVEYVIDAAREAHRAGKYAVFVTNGYGTEEMVRAIKGYVDAVVVDYKGSGEELFQRRQTMTVSAEPIKSTLLELKAQKIHTELTDLVIPQVGEDLDEARKLCRWLFDNLGPDAPIQFTRFHPDYKMLDVPVTPYELLVKHHKLATEAGLNYAYIGNVPGSPQEHTYCPGCRGVAIERHGFMITGWNLDENYRCRTCGQRIPIEGKRATKFRYRGIESFFIPNPR